MTIPMNNMIHRYCDKCKHEIPMFSTHISVIFKMWKDGREASSLRRYCADCCYDPSMAVLFADILQQPVSLVTVKKVWG